MTKLRSVRHVSKTCQWCWCYLLTSIIASESTWYWFKLSCAFILIRSEVNLICWFWCWCRFHGSYKLLYYSLSLNCLHSLVVMWYWNWPGFEGMVDTPDSLLFFLFVLLRCMGLQTKLIEVMHELYKKINFF